MQNDHTKRLTMGAVIIAIFTVVLAVSFYVPILNLVTSLFIALPIIWYSAKFERNDSLLVVFACLGMSYFVGGVLALVLALLYAPLGFVIGEAIKRKKSKLYLFMAAGLTFLFSSVIQYLVTVLFLNINPIQEFLYKLRQISDEFLVTMETLEDIPKGYAERWGEALYMFEIQFPSFVIIVLFVTAFTIILVNLPILTRLGLDIPKFNPFREMRLPKAVLWYYLVVLVVTLFVELDKGSFAFMVFANATVILRGLLTLQGISFIHYYIHVQGWPKWVVVVATVLAFPLQSFIVLLGVLDLGFNIRSFIKDMNRK